MTEQSGVGWDEVQQGLPTDRKFPFLDSTGSRRRALEKLEKNQKWRGSRMLKVLREKSKSIEEIAIKLDME